MSAVTSREQKQSLFGSLRCTVVYRAQLSLDAGGHGLPPSLLRLCRSATAATPKFASQAYAPQVDHGRLLQHLSQLAYNATATDTTS